MLKVRTSTLTQAKIGWRQFILEETAQSSRDAAKVNSDFEIGVRDQLLGDARSGLLDY